MKRSFFIIVPFILLIACKTNEPDYSRIAPVSATKIDSLQVIGKQVEVTTVYMIPSTCWYYYSTEKTNDDKTFTCKVFGKTKGEICLQVVGSFKHKEQVNFLTAGLKKLKFWQSDSAYLDTTITLQ